MTITITELENDNPRRMKPRFEIRCAETNDVKRVYTKSEANAIAAQWEAQKPTAVPANDTKTANNAPAKKYLSGPTCTACGCLASIPTYFGTQCADCLAMGEL